MDQLTLFAEDSLANRSVVQENNERKQMTVISGLRCSELYKSASPLGSLVRMLLASSSWHSKIVLLTWKAKGTKSNRLLFRLVPSTLHTEGTGSGFWRTPETMQGGTVSEEVLEEMARGEWTRPSGQQRQLRLQDQVRHPGLFPTPVARDYKGSRSPEAMKASGRNPLTNNLCDAIEQTEIGGTLNPMWVEWLMGYPIGHTDLKH